MTRSPFEQLPYEDVPELPRVPHAWDKTRVIPLSFRSKPFGDVDVHVRTFGEGPPLVLVHGLMTSGYSFRYVLEPLGRHFTLFIPDLVGSGRSSKPEGSYHPDRIAAALGETLRALGVWGAPMIGNSMGGYLAMRLALLDRASFDLPETPPISKLVNLHSPGLPTARMNALFLATRTPFARAALDAMVKKDPLRWVHKNVHYFDETLKSREEHREYAAPLTTPEGRRAFAKTLEETLDVREMRAFERTLRERSFPVPMLLVYVPKDPMVPPEIGERLARLVPEAKLVWLKEGSHFAHVDAVPAFLDAALPFLV